MQIASTAVIDKSVILGKDVVIHEFVVIYPNVVIEDCVEIMELQYKILIDRLNRLALCQ